MKHLTKMENSQPRESTFFSTCKQNHSQKGINFLPPNLKTKLWSTTIQVDSHHHFQFPNQIPKKNSPGSGTKLDA